MMHIFPPEKGWGCFEKDHFMYVFLDIWELRTEKYLRSDQVSPIPEKYRLKLKIDLIKDGHAFRPEKHSVLLSPFFLWIYCQLEVQKKLSGYELKIWYAMFTRLLYWVHSLVTVKKTSWLPIRQFEGHPCSSC